MQSPFPGTDPYLEQHWLDVHARLMLYACDQLEEQLPGSLIARVEERVVFEAATETFINILDAEAGHHVVTVIEILSLSNKLPGKGQREYRRKQTELQQARVNLVEIDLLRKGHRVFLVPVARIPRQARTTYQACVWRASKPDQCEVYPMPLRNQLPGLRIPLRDTDKDIRLDLQAIVDLAYRKGRYLATLDYGQPPDPPLPGPDAKWAQALLKKAKKKM